MARTLRATFFDSRANATTYRLPRADAIDRWLAAVPRDFCFAVKLSRLITHRRNLGNNDREANAVRNAFTLRDMLTECRRS
ncbi:MAG: DUF72 domain-containing protein [Vulcanimicrobiaceae bacterium]